MNDAGYKLDRPKAFGCPECGGAMLPEEDGALLSFRCHIGHILTAETMLVAQFTALEIKLGAVLAALNERAEICRRMGDEAATEGVDPAVFDAARREALDRAALVKELLESEWVNVGHGSRIENTA